MKKTILTLAAASLFASGVAAAPAPAPAPEPEPVAAQEAKIPFANRTIRNFHAIGRDVVYLEGPGQWYRATLALDCINLQYSNAIGIDTRGTSALDRFGAIVVDGQHCPIQSLVKSGPPPKKDDQQKS